MHFCYDMHTHLATILRYWPSGYAYYNNHLPWLAWLKVGHIVLTLWDKNNQQPLPCHHPQWTTSAFLLLLAWHVPLNPKVVPCAMLLSFMLSQGGKKYIIIKLPSIQNAHPLILSWPTPQSTSQYLGDATTATHACNDITIIATAQQQCKYCSNTGWVGVEQVFPLSTVFYPLPSKRLLYNGCVHKKEPRLHQLQCTHAII